MSYLCTSKFNNLKFTIMKQNEMNSQKAQELTKEELEQVNGGKVTIQDILKSTTAIWMFPCTHRGQVPQVHQENKKPLGLVAESGGADAPLFLCPQGLGDLHQAQPVAHLCLRPWMNIPSIWRRKYGFVLPSPTVWWPVTYQKKNKTI